MKKIFSPLVVIILPLLLQLGSCTKSDTTKPANNNNNNNNAVNYLVASYTAKNTTNGVSQTAVYTYTYDGQNRLIGTQYSNGTPSVTYTYGTGTVTKTSGTSVTVYTLNSAGEAVSDDQGDTFTYDSNGYLLMELNADGASTFNTYSNENEVSSVVTPSGGASTSYEYTYTSTPATLKFGLTFLGASSVDLIQSESISGLGDYPFTYTFDSEGRVSTLKIVSGASTLLRTYTYVN